MTAASPAIHPTAVIHPTATLGQGVSVGPFSVIGPGCVVGDETVIASHVVLEANVRLGKNCQVASCAVLGGLPQDYSFGGETSWVDIGDRSVIREYVTINRATGEGQSTRLGEDCMIMAYTHIAHNCQLADHVVLANAVQLAGHVHIGDHVFISGTCLVHQFVKIGRLAFVCPFSGTRQDIPPFAMTEGRPEATVVGTNKVGLKRAGFSLDERTRLKKAFHILCYEGLNITQAIEKIDAELAMGGPVTELVAFLKASGRGINRPDAGTTGTPSAETVGV
ncbi:MAG: acyl-ACP--UDP-N-acetylglucosamine O-acyltransferase [Candidatus Melainabacteria bacterium]